MSDRGSEYGGQVKSFFSNALSTITTASGYGTLGGILVGVCMQPFYESSGPGNAFLTCVGIGSLVGLCVSLLGMKWGLFGWQNPLEDDDFEPIPQKSRGQGWNDEDFRSVRRPPPRKRVQPEDVQGNTARSAGASWSKNRPPVAEEKPSDTAASQNRSYAYSSRAGATDAEDEDAFFGAQRPRTGASSANGRGGKSAAQSDAPFGGTSSARGASVDMDDDETFANARTPVPPPPRAESSMKNNDAMREMFATCFARAFLLVARADGVTRPQEMAVVDRFFSQKLGFGDEDAALVDRALTTAESKRDNIPELARDIQRALNHAEMLMMFGGLYDLATINGVLEKSEEAAIDGLARALGISQVELRRIRAQFLKFIQQDVPLDSNYALLGLEPDATDAEIKKAFHKAALENHPDRVAHLGEQASQMATARFLEIQKAYEAIRIERGL